MRKIVIFFLFVPFLLNAQNLEQLIELSKNNKMLDSSRIGIDSTKDLFDSVQKGYLPKLTFGASHSYNDYETSTVPEYNSQVKGSIDYVLYDGGKKYDTYDYYEATIKKEQTSMQNLKNQIALQVTNYYYNYLSLIDQKKVKLQEIDQLQAQYSRLKNFLEVGTTTKDEVEKIISSIQRANVALHEIELNIQTITHNLEYVVGQQVTINDGSVIKDYDSTNSKLRADIKSLQFQLDSLKANADSKNSENYPTISINDTYSYNDLNFESAASSYDYERNTATINLSWKLFDFGSTSKAYQAAYKKYLSMKSQYEYEKNRASVDLKLALKSYDIAKLKIKSSQAAVLASSSAYDVIKSKYENGLVDNVAYLEALTDKQSALSELKSSKYNLEIRKANIIYFSGENLEEFIK